MNVMKNTTAYLAIAALLAACSAATPTDDLGKKRAELDSLKASHAATGELIKEAQAWLSANDSSLQRALTSVTVHDLALGAFAHEVQVHGTVKADQNALLHTTLGGTVRAILVRPGMNVRKGQRIVDIDTDALSKQIDQLEANLTLANEVYERQSKLWEQKIGSEIQYLQARSSKESLDASIAALREQWNSAQIMAPFDGVVDEIFPNVGDMANPLMPVARVVALGRASIECDVAEAYLNSVKGGDPVTVRLSGTADEFTATVEHVGQFVNPNNRTFKVSLKAPDGVKLRPNQLASVSIRDLAQEGAIVLPSRMVMENSKGQSYVFVLDEDNGTGVAHKRFVKPLMTYQGNVMVARDSTGGLQGNERLIDEGSRLIVDQQRVSVRKGA